MGRGGEEAKDSGSDGGALPEVVATVEWVSIPALGTVPMGFRSLVEVILDRSRVGTRAAWWLLVVAATWLGARDFPGAQTLVGFLLCLVAPMAMEAAVERLDEVLPGAERPWTPGRVLARIWILGLSTVATMATVGALLWSPFWALAWAGYAVAHLVTVATMLGRPFPGTLTSPLCLVPRMFLPADHGAALPPRRFGAFVLAWLAVPVGVVLGGILPMVMVALVTMPIQSLLPFAPKEMGIAFGIAGALAGLDLSMRLVTLAAVWVLPPPEEAPPALPAPQGS